VDFDPVRAKAEGRPTGLPDDIAALFPDSFEDSELEEIPKGWKSRSLYESAKYINGAAYRNFHFTDEEGALPVIKIAELKNGVSGQTKFTKTELDDKYRISDGEILLSWSGNPDTSIGTFVWRGGPAWLNQHIFRVLPHQEIEKHFVFYLLKYLRPVFAEIARDKQTTGLGHFTARDMKQLMVVHPPENILAAFNDSVGPMFDRWYGNLFESNTLASLRDTLLPKLISGEMRVPDAEKFVEEAGL
jgi:type I restriction enzyme S subunit